MLWLLQLESLSRFHVRNITAPITDATVARGASHIPGRSRNKPSLNATHLHEDSGILHAEIFRYFPANFLCLQLLITMCKICFKKSLNIIKKTCVYYIMLSMKQSHIDR